MGSCYEKSQPDRPKIEIATPKPMTTNGNPSIGMTLQSAKNLAKLGTKMLASKLVNIIVFLSTQNVIYYSNIITFVSLLLNIVLLILN